MEACPFGLGLCLLVFLGAEPFLAPNDPFLRHEIRLLGDEGGLNSLQNTWPLDLGGLHAMRSESRTLPIHLLSDQRLSQRSPSLGGLPIVQPWFG